VLRASYVKTGENDIKYGKLCSFYRGANNLVYKFVRRQEEKFLNNLQILSVRLVNEKFMQRGGDAAHFLFSLINIGVACVKSLFLVNVIVSA